MKIFQWIICNFTVTYSFPGIGKKQLEWISVMSKIIIYDSVHSWKFPGLMSEILGFYFATIVVIIFVHFQFIPIYFYLIYFFIYLNSSASGL